MFNFLETRAQTLPDINISIPQSWGDYAATITGDSVTEETALSVTSIWQAVNVIGGTIAALPLQLFKDSADGAVKDTANSLYYVLNARPNAFQTRQSFMKWVITRLLIDGRATVKIAKNKAGRVGALIPLTGEIKIRQLVDGTTVDRIYVHKLPNSSIEEKFPSADVLDFVLFPHRDTIRCYSPIETNRDAIALMIAAQKYSSTLLANGGVPPLVLQTPSALSPQAAGRASVDVSESVKASQRTRSNILALPAGHELKDISIDPSKNQLVELRRFMISEAARIMNVAPAILHDLSDGTYANTEQQMISFSRQTIAPLAEMLEQEMNAKLFGARNTINYVKFNVNGILRGDFVSRMTGYAQAIQNGILTPNEVREMEERSALPNGDDLLIQGATVPLGSQPTAQQANGDQQTDASE